jgi:valyl-tRNA synthetase
MALVVGNTPGTDLALREDKVKGYKHFANKLWNIARFVLDNTRYAKTDAALTPTDQAHLDVFEALAKDVTTDLDEYRIYLAAEKLYHYVWHELADKILEESKPILTGSDEAAKASREALLVMLLHRSITMLHPFMPFVTEEIYQSLPSKNNEYLMIAPWGTTQTQTLAP